MTLNVHLAQFDVAPTRNLIISSCKIAKCDVTLGGGLRNVTTCDKRGGVNTSLNSYDVIYGWPNNM